MAAFRAGDRVFFQPVDVERAMVETVARFNQDPRAACLTSAQRRAAKRKLCNDLRRRQRMKVCAVHTLVDAARCQLQSVPDFAAVATMYGDDVSVLWLGSPSEPLPLIPGGKYDAFPVIELSDGRYIGLEGSELRIERDEATPEAAN
jgi:hypothetical protein